MGTIGIIIGIVFLGSLIAMSFSIHNAESNEGFDEREKKIIKEYNECESKKTFNDYFKITCYNYYDDGTGSHKYFSAVDTDRVDLTDNIREKLQKEYDNSDKYGIIKTLNKEGKDLNLDDFEMIYGYIHHYQVDDTLDIAISGRMKKDENGKYKLSPILFYNEACIIRIMKDNPNTFITKENIKTIKKEIKKYEKEYGKEYESEK